MQDIIRWLVVNDHEVINNCRTMAYVEAGLVPGWMSNVGCDDRCCCAGKDGDFPSPGTGDIAPWWEAGNPASYEFFGLAVDRAALSVPMTRVGSTDFRLGTLTLTKRTIAVNGVLLASSHEGAWYGRQWLMRTLTSCGDCCASVAQVAIDCGADREIWNVGLAALDFQEEVDECGSVKFVMALEARTPELFYPLTETVLPNNWMTLVPEGNCTMGCMGIDPNAYTPVLVFPVAAQCAPPALTPPPLGTITSNCFCEPLSIVSECTILDNSQTGVESVITFFIHNPGEGEARNIRIMLVDGRFLTTPPEPAPSLPFLDDFERTSIGSNWVLAANPTQWGGPPFPFAIATGAAVGTQSHPYTGPGGSVYATNKMHWHEPQGPSQSIQIHVDKAVWTHAGTFPLVALYTNMNDANYESEYAEFDFNVSAGSIHVHLKRLNIDDETDGGTITVNHDPTADVRFAFTSDVDGTQTAYVDGVPVLTWVDPAPVTGPFVGMGSDFTASEAPPRIVSAGSFAGATFYDDFERTSLGSNWEMPVALPVGSSNQATDIVDPFPFTISSGTAVGPTDTTGDTGAIGRWFEPIPGNQYVEATVTFPGSGPVASDLPLVDFYLCLKDNDHTCYDAQLLQNQDGFRLRWFHWVDGAVAGISTDYFHIWAGPQVITMRFEATQTGAVRALIGNAVVSTYDFAATATGGTRVGMASKFQPGTGGGGAVLRIESIGGGTLVDSSGGGNSIYSSMPPAELMEAIYDVAFIPSGATLTIHGPTGQSWYDYGGREWPANSYVSGYHGSLTPRPILACDEELWLCVVIDGEALPSNGLEVTAELVAREPA